MVATTLNQRSQRKALWRAVADEARPRVRLARDRWCEENLVLPPDLTPAPGPFRFDNYPYVREWLLMMDNPAVREITIMAGTQIAKTQTLQAGLASQSDLCPSPMILATPDQDATRELRSKFYRMCDESPTMRAKIPPKRLRNDQWIDFGNCLCHLAWAGSPQRLSAKACRWALLTEVDRWPKPAHEAPSWKLIEERVKAFWRYLIVREGTPTDDTSTIASLYDRSDRRTFHVPCPHCDHYQELRFFTHREGPHAGCGGIGGMQDADGNWLDMEEARKAAYYICENGCRIESAQKGEMIDRGVWCPRGRKVVDGKLTGTPERGPRHVGFHISSLYPKHISFGDVAAAYLDSREDPGEFQNFINNWLGLKHRIQTRTPKWRWLARRLAGGHRRGFVPQPALFLTCGADVQQDRVYWTIRAWGEGCTSWLVDCGVFTMRIDEAGQMQKGSDLEQLDALLAKKFPFVQPNPLGLEQIMLRLLCIDTGYAERALEVWTWIKSHPGDRVRGVAGQAHKANQYFHPTAVEVNPRTGKRLPDGLTRWMVNVDTYKGDIQNRWFAQLDKPGAWWLFSNPIEECEDYLRQVVNEGPIAQRDSKGRPKHEWRVIDVKLGNHYWDCEVYGRAGADMVTGCQWENLVDEAQRQQPDKKAKSETKRGRRDDPRGGMRPAPVGWRR